MTGTFLTGHKLQTGTLGNTLLSIALRHSSHFTQSPTHHRTFCFQTGSRWRCRTTFNGSSFLVFLPPNSVSVTLHNLTPIKTEKKLTDGGTYQLFL